MGYIRDRMRQGRHGRARGAVLLAGCGGAPRQTRRAVGLVQLESPTRSSPRRSRSPRARRWRSRSATTTPRRRRRAVTARTSAKPERGRGFRHESTTNRRPTPSTRGSSRSPAGATPGQQQLELGGRGARPRHSAGRYGDRARLYTIKYRVSPASTAGEAPPRPHRRSSRSHRRQAVPARVNDKGESERRGAGASRFTRRRSRPGRLRSAPPRGHAASRLALDEVLSSPVHDRSST